tara:strand:+ start:738 stop:1151 length:414 start_codon:yes stop_codon:yes gene_type:complete
MNNNISQISSSMNQFSPTDKINDLYKIINNNYADTSSSIYNEILNREKDMKDLIERVVEYKNKEKLSAQFTQKSIADVSNNLFKTLNKILEESTDDNNISFKKIKEAVNQDDRRIYLGLFLVIMAVSLLLIEVSDKI